jgi:hypothetical protein
MKWNMELNFWRKRKMKMKLKSYFLYQEKTMVLSHILLEEEEDWCRSCY